MEFATLETPFGEKPDGVRVFPVDCESIHKRRPPVEKEKTKICGISLQVNWKNRPHPFRNPE
jgi:hypothetical protein